MDLREALHKQISKMSDDEIEAVKCFIEDMAHKPSTNTDLQAGFEEAANARPLPTVAPMLWQNRLRGGKTDPVKFIRDVYKEWIGKGLSRSLIKKLDVDLYNAYSGHIKPNRHPEDSLWPDKDGSQIRLSKRGLSPDEQLKHRQKQLRDNYVRRREKGRSFS